jgi:anti-sigma regulatory factor (Ser/Thr protein kinase)
MSTLRVRHAPSSAAVARRRIQASFRDSGLSDEDAFDAALIASELVANAVRHAAPLPSGHLAVEWILEADGYRISVTDGGSQHRVSSRPANGRDLSGRGLAIVAALAQDWGVSTNVGSAYITVWARGVLQHSASNHRARLQTTK